MLVDDDIDGFIVGAGVYENGMGYSLWYMDHWTI